MTEEQYHIIDQYLRNELEGESLAAFERQLRENAGLAETVQLFKLMNNEMPALLKNRPGGEALKKNLQQISKPHFKNKEAAVVHIKKNNWYKLTAAAAMLIAIAGISMWQFTKNDTGNLYAQYINDETISLTSRGNINQDTLAKITEYYNDHQYAAVNTIAAGHNSAGYSKY